MRRLLSLLSLSLPASLAGAQGPDDPAAAPRIGPTVAPASAPSTTAPAPHTEKAPPAPAPPGPRRADDPRAAHGLPAPIPKPPARPPRPKMTVTVDADQSPITEDTLDRMVAEAVFARGPQYIAASVRVEPAREGRRFIGFRILGFDPQSPFAEAKGLRVGDVVLRANGESIERPESFMRAWTLARQADHIELRVLRDGEVQRLRWQLVP